MPTILIVDGDEEQRTAVRELLSRRADWEIRETADPAEMSAWLEDQPIDLVIAGQAMMRDDRDLLGELRRKHVRVPVLVLSEGDSDQVEALVMGAASYVPRSSMARDLVVVTNRLLTLAGCRRRHARLLDGLLATEVKFRIAGNDLTMIPVLCGYLLDEFEEFGLGGNGNRMQVAVALEEAMTNGIVHGNLEVSSRLRDRGLDDYDRAIAERRESTPFSHRLLVVTGHYTTDVAVVEIRDEGPGFDPSRVVDPTDPRNLERPHGRGLYLIRAFASEVRFNASGNQITLVFRKPPVPDAPEDERSRAATGHDADGSRTAG